jgi:1,4-dihydroxy-2-naphthoate octaprenyltransferase
MNPSMWLKALRVIPRIDKDEWQKLDVISKWLISTRAAVLIMTFLSAALAGIFAAQVGQFNFLRWLLVAVGLVLSHATNNLLNDYTDFAKGVDQDNYYRAEYGPHPLVHGLMTKRQLLTYAGVTGALAAACGIVLIAMTDWNTAILMGLGVFFVLFYTWPLKYIALGELAVLVVWGPLMIGGGYYVIAGSWDWNVVLGSLPYALGVTGVIFGKHIDKFQIDKSKGIHTLPVVIGETASRFILIGMLVLQYLLTIYLVVSGFFTFVMLIVAVAIPTFVRIWPILRAPKPEEKPADYPDVWPNYFVAGAFIHNRSFGVWFMLGLIVDTIIKALS